MINIILLSIVISLLAFILEFKSRKYRQLPPGPFPWPIVGNIGLVRSLSRQIRGQHRAFLELSRRYSTNYLSLKLGKLNVIVVSGYSEIKKILAGDEFDGRPWTEFTKLRNMGLKKGITMTDGHEWKIVRGWVVKAMRQVGFGRAEMSTQIDEELQFLLDKLEDGGIFQIKSVIAPAMINIIWRLATGKRIMNEEKLRYFIQLMERRAKAFDISGGILSVFPWLRYIAPEASGYKLLNTLNREVKDFLMSAIEEHQKHYVPGGVNVDLIEMFYEDMNNEKANHSIFNEEQLFMILLDLLIAGSVTTTTTLDFLFLHMTIHQDVQRRLHEEFDSVIGRNRLPTLNDKPNLPYLEAVMTESQRVQMTVPIIGPRRALCETYLDGYRIPKDTCILINLASVHVNPEYYPNPEIFQPERFMKDGSFVPDDKLIFFGRGHRRCPGEADARASVFLAFTSIMQRFQLLPDPDKGPPDPEPIYGITASAKPYKILLVPRK